MFASLTTLLALVSLAPAAFAAPVLLSGSGSASASVSVSLSTDLVFKAQGFGSDYYKSKYVSNAFRALYPGRPLFCQDPIGNVIPNSHTEPLSCLFPLTSTLGYKISPTLDHLIGHEAVEHIDTAADALCISSERDESGGGGACQNVLAAIDDVVQAKGGPIFQAKAVAKLLNFLCVAQNADPSTGLCQFLFAGIDCNANRLIGADDLECQPKQGWTK